MLCARDIVRLEARRTMWVPHNLGKPFSPFNTTARPGDGNRQATTEKKDIAIQGTCYSSSLVSPTDPTSEYIPRLRALKNARRSPAMYPVSYLSPPGVVISSTSASYEVFFRAAYPNKSSISYRNWQWCMQPFPLGTTFCFPLSSPHWTPNTVVGRNRG